MRRLHVLWKSLNKSAVNSILILLPTNEGARQMQEDFSRASVHPLFAIRRNAYET
jgi:phage baseplate assembly protein W